MKWRHCTCKIKTDIVTFRDCRMHAKSQIIQCLTVSRSLCACASDSFDWL